MQDFSGIFLPEWAGFLFNFYWNFSRGVTANLLTKESYQSLPWILKTKTKKKFRTRSSRSFALSGQVTQPALA